MRTQMKLPTLLKIAVPALLLLGCLGVIISLFFRISAVDEGENFNLYTLVPSDAIAVVEMDDSGELIQHIAQLSEENSSLLVGFSNLFSLIHEELYGAAKGANLPVRKLLLSFHEPDEESGQLLYYQVEGGDYKDIEQGLARFAASAFPPKSSVYKGETIRVYPLSDGRFLACYFHPQFVVVSFQKKRIEQVLDLCFSKKSLWDDAAFQAVCGSDRMYAATTVFVRTDLSDPETSSSVNALGRWREFDLQLKERALSLTSMEHLADSCLSSEGTPVGQLTDSLCSNEYFPATTLLLCRKAIPLDGSVAAVPASDEEGMMALWERNAAFLSFLQTCGGEQLTTCFFEALDTIRAPIAVTMLSLRDTLRSEELFRSLLPPTSALPLRLPAASRGAKSASSHAMYRLPHNTLLSRMINRPGINPLYGCFYRHQLLLGADPADLSLYMDMLASGAVIDAVSLCDESLRNSSEAYQWMLYLHPEKSFALPADQLGWIPDFVRRNAPLFAHLKLALHSVCVDGLASTSIALLHRE